MTWMIYFLGQMPLLAVWIVGIVLAIKNWEHYQKASLLALLGFTTLILETIVFSIINMALPQFLNSISASEIGLYYSAIGAVRTLLEAVSFGLLVAAIFTQRYKK
jgi:hypothetical protein